MRLSLLSCALLVNQFLAFSSFNKLILPMGAIVIEKKVCISRRARLFDDGHVETAALGCPSSEARLLLSPSPDA